MPNQAMQPTAGRCDVHIGFYETVVRIYHARSRERWLSLFSLDVVDAMNRIAVGIAFGMFPVVAGAAGISPKSLDSFVEDFRAACKSGDIRQVESLVWWGRATPEMRRDIKAELKQAVSNPITSIQIGLLPTRYRSSKEMRRATLAPTHELFVRYGPLDHTRFFLGQRHGRFYIVVYTHQWRVAPVITQTTSNQTLQPTRSRLVSSFP